MGIDDQLLVIFEKQIYLFSPAFVVACSNSLLLLKSINANWLRVIKVGKMLAFWGPFVVKCMVNFQNPCVWKFSAIFQVIQCFLLLTIFCNALNSSKSALRQSFDLTSVFVKRCCSHLLNCLPVLHLYIFWTWNKTLSHFSRNNSLSPLQVAQAH